MTTEQLRKALSELNGERDLNVAFAHAYDATGQASHCTVKRAMLVPEEGDDLVKVTDGKHIYIFDAERVVWLRIG